MELAASVAAQRIVRTAVMRGQAPLLQVGGERLDRRMAVDVEDGHVFQVCVLAELGNHAGGEKRVAPQIEKKIVAYRDRVRGEQRLPDLQELKFEVGART